MLVVRLPRNAVIGAWSSLSVLRAQALAAAVTFAVAEGPVGAANAGIAGWFAVLFSMIGAHLRAGSDLPTGRGPTPAWIAGSSPPRSRFRS
jgi:hypothetical protein